FHIERERKLEDLRTQVAPLKVERLKLQAKISQLTYESAIAPINDNRAYLSLEEAQRQLDELQEHIDPIQAQIDQLSRQFWVDREQIRKKGYDLSASQYRKRDRDEI